jgi:hypothetical protein
MLDDIDAEASAALRDNAVLKKHEAIQSAAVMLLSGYIESFLRDAAENFFEELGDTALFYTDLSPDMQLAHYLNGAQTLAQIVDREKRDKPLSLTETVSAVKALIYPISNNSPKLFWKAFAQTRSNPGPEVIKDFLRNFDIKDPLTHLGTKSGYSANHIESQLRTLIKLRNECAHTGSLKSVPSPGTIRDYINFLRKICYGIAKLLTERLVCMQTP